MTNEIAIITAAGITVLGSVVTFVAHLLFEDRREKRAIKERNQHDLLNMRLELYKDIAAEMTKFGFSYPYVEITNKAALAGEISAIFK